ncbi:MAG: DUF523 domain-containing protein [Firmicutes bacterium]|nr:DUF523 domain-containing protein [Bacillota bacterium]
MILVSACLLGDNCKYNGGNNYTKEIARLKRDIVLPVCPEELGGLLTPRLPAQFDRADGEALLDGRCKVWDAKGNDVTQNFLSGAAKALAMAQRRGVHTAILKERSPSCGVSSVYITERGTAPVVGMGVTAALLKKNGIKVLSDEKLHQWLPLIERDL